MYKIEYTDSAKRDRPKLSSKAKLIIQDAINKKLATDPIRFGKPLRHNLKGLRSLRVSSYRVIYLVKDDVVIVTNIRHRKDVYEE